MGWRGVVAFTIAAIVFPGAAHPQQAAPVFPPRPGLDPGTDTNSATAYYAKAVEWLARNPRRARDAFHWATLLEPNDGGAYYGRWVAGLLSQPRLLEGFFEEIPRVLRSAEYRSNDSLLWLGEALNPFYFQALQEVLFRGYLTHWCGSRNPQLLDADMRFAFDQYLRTEAGPYVRAMVAYTYRNFPRALDQLALALRTARHKTGLHWTRALVHHHMGQLDSAAAELRFELEQERLRDTTEEVVFYQSKALLELSLGRVLEQLGDLEGAHDAYLRSAAENLAYAPAHIRLASFALGRADTATALSEVAIALDVESADPAWLVQGSVLLIGAGRALDAVPHLERAVALNPHYAVPYFLLGRLSDVSGVVPEAVGHYRAFLARAGRDDHRIAMVRERLAALQPDSAPTRDH
jgi:hypothetical protein